MVTLIRTKQKNVMFHLQNVGNMVAFKLEYRQYYKHTQLDSPQHSINRCDVQSSYWHNYVYYNFVIPEHQHHNYCD